MSTPAVLVAEDDPNDASILRWAFARAGVNVPLYFVSDGQEAIDYLRGAPPFENRAQHPSPALMLLDLRMPRVSGFEVLVWLRGQPALASLPAVILSSSWEGEDMRRANLLGATAYHVKPQDANQLVSMVRFFAFCWLGVRSGCPPLRPVLGNPARLGASGGTRTVLVADDNEDDVLLLRCAFQEAGLSHTIIHARNGQEAINCFKGIGAPRLWLPDLLLLDLKMPLLDGFDLLGWIRTTSRALPQWQSRGVPVVVLSASDLAVEKQKAKDLGAYDYVLKPGSFEEWITVARSLDERWLRAQR